MASKIIDRGSVFLQKLVAPLPEFEEQVATDDFLKQIARDLRQIERDMKQVWRRSLENVEYAEALHRIAAINFRNSPEAAQHSFGQRSLELTKAYKSVCEQRAAQCLIPAPTSAELRWKKRWAKNRTVPDEVIKAISSDEARLGTQTAPPDKAISTGSGARR
ncbi:MULTISPECIES: hypothetical protein [unclassified Sphingomonas]|uniref:hypothetical protein n=1 Tax=unclassified Sphingomonas TaxID=196159 RepID=UPI0006F27662|nr:MULTISPECIES: hypothetical protein [unclassified Sphingomonas]KQS48249.1 hypothetical protein ASG20_14180 [Sphingomonas sp. Leaf198]